MKFNISLAECLSAKNCPLAFVRAIFRSHLLYILPCTSIPGMKFSSLGMASISSKEGTQHMENRIKILFFGGKGVCRMSEPCIIKKST